MKVKRDKRQGKPAAGLVVQTRPKCANLQCHNPTSKKGKHRDGWIIWRAYCSACHQANRGLQSYAPEVVPVRKDYCENIDGRLGEVCEAKNLRPFQFDLDHVDGNKENTAPENLQTLCKNCHALKTMQEGDNSPGRHSIRERYKDQEQSRMKIFSELFG